MPSRSYISPPSSTHSDSNEPQNLVNPIVLPPIRSLFDEGRLPFFVDQVEDLPFGGADDPVAPITTHRHDPGSAFSDSSSDISSIFSQDSAPISPPLTASLHSTASSDHFYFEELPLSPPPPYSELESFNLNHNFTSDDPFNFYLVEEVAYEHAYELAQAAYNSTDLDLDSGVIADDEMTNAGDWDYLMTRQTTAPETSNIMERYYAGVRFLQEHGLQPSEIVSPTTFLYSQNIENQYLSTSIVSSEQPSTPDVSQHPPLDAPSSETHYEDPTFKMDTPIERWIEDASQEDEVTEDNESVKTPVNSPLVDDYVDYDMDEEYFF
ncbi:hypothetical protein WICANDRAFT_85078 [Wickerhamomyces anomalus NRRL Y-366-8]|uniref:Uncharacterized protein n=1 Tax=Wickerhamomyces anomalus (strain ATCC 58044 / CBS 1984 / NCYC 433 / NRRL Y-366-8) TaxID=683960 RepID=A0A1E3NY10_WICAA|nr:uncharacterized protein WICANDRAFT_85078 [Wickerhamomyces anomalus NRRL Y-366-8]ODQ57890.1 hypothetical protein WICANDRAFT_85078 [Wickerhamomyces anomalus NRRL Y-366-8]